MPWRGPPRPMKKTNTPPIRATRIPVSQRWPLRICSSISGLSSCGSFFGGWLAVAGLLCPECDPCAAAGGPRVRSDPRPGKRACCLAPARADSDRRDEASPELAVLLPSTPAGTFGGSGERLETSHEIRYLQGALQLSERSVEGVRGVEAPVGTLLEIPVGSLVEAVVEQHRLNL